MTRPKLPFTPAFTPAVEFLTPAAGQQIAAGEPFEIGKAEVARIRAEMDSGGPALFELAVEFGDLFFSLCDFSLELASEVSVGNTSGTGRISPGARGSEIDDPEPDRRGQGGRPRAAGTQRQADRDGLSGTDFRRLGCRFNG